MAKDLRITCYHIYANASTGLCPEIVYFNSDPQLNEQTIIVRDNDVHNFLCPAIN